MMSPNIPRFGAHPPEQGTMIYKISHSMSLLHHQLTKEGHFRGGGGGRGERKGKKKGK